jgi:hypothetical protein
MSDEKTIDNSQIIKLREKIEQRMARGGAMFHKARKDLDELQSKCKHTEGWNGNDFGPGALRECKICGYSWCK